MAGSEPPMEVNHNYPHPTAAKEPIRGQPDYGVLLYIPNIIGYVRLLFLLMAFCFTLPHSPASFVTFYTISVVLDAVDGYTARKFHQCSIFGAWFDVLLDNVGRGLLWTHIHPMLYLVAVLEWTAFVCNHSLGAQWRDSLMVTEDMKMPPVVTWVMAKNFRTRWGVWAIAGLHVLPLWLVGLQYDVFNTHLWFLPSFVQYLGVVILGTGRLVCAFVEVWSIWVHILHMLVNVSSAS